MVPSAERQTAGVAKVFVEEKRVDEAAEDAVFVASEKISDRQPRRRGLTLIIVYFLDLSP